MKIGNILHHCVRLPLQKLGIHICRSHKFPICTVSLLDLVVPAFLPKFDDFVICQIGASDGKTSDPLEHLIQKYQLKGILIEPLPSSFELLKEKFIFNDNITCINCAISDTDGSVKFFCPKKGGHYDNLSSFQKSGMSKKSLLQAGIPQADIEEITVSSKTLLQVMKEQYLDKIHLLQIDTEGFDFEIVKHALKLPFSPPIIHFETIHLSRMDKLHSRELLTAQGYSLIESETDTLAYQFGFPV